MSNDIPKPMPAPEAVRAVNEQMEATVPEQGDKVPTQEDFEKAYAKGKQEIEKRFDDYGQKYPDAKADFEAAKQNRMTELANLKAQYSQLLNELQSRADLGRKGSQEKTVKAVQNAFSKKIPMPPGLIEPGDDDSVPVIPEQKPRKFAPPTGPSPLIEVEDAPLPRLMKPGEK